MNDWQTILTTAHETIPIDEWWYELPLCLSDIEYTCRIKDAEKICTEYTRQIKDAEKIFASRFGYPPDAIPRVVFIGNTPVLAYPCPEQPYDMAQLTPPTEEPAQLTMEGFS